MRAAKALGSWWNRLPVRDGRLALLLLNLAVLICGLESLYVQMSTTGKEVSLALFGDFSILLLFFLDLLLPLTVALLSRRAFFIYLAGQCALSTILLHYDVFFYNPLTLSTIYHSMQGAASLGIDIFGFARTEIILFMGALFAFKVLLARLAMTPEESMPGLWRLRGVTAVFCMACICWISFAIYGRTGLSVLWVDSMGHRTATERRLEEGTRQAVQSIGYLATWIGEWMSGTYKDTALIHAEAFCGDPDRDNAPMSWQGLPLPPLGQTVLLIQAESLDFAALGISVNGVRVMPFLDSLLEDSVLLKVFAPHKVGSSNSDYELLNGRVAEQNVIYYSYIKEYPDSAIFLLRERGYDVSLFHGLPGNLFNLREAYSAQGFNGMSFKEELLADGYRASRYIMDHVLDEDVFDSAAKHLDRAEGKQAELIITMSSHVPFMDPLPVFRSAGGRFARYVSSLHYLDQCLAAFYQLLPDGSTLIIWGDHGSDVQYPPGFKANSRHVPFIAHVKGDSAWLGKVKAGRPENVAGPGLRELGKLWEAQSVEPAFPRLSKADIHGLCEMHYYLRRIFSQE